MYYYTQYSIVYIREHLVKMLPKVSPDVEDPQVFPETLDRPEMTENLYAHLN